VRAFVRLRIPVQLVDVPEWGTARLPAEAAETWFDTLGQPVAGEITLHFTMPHQVVPSDRPLDVNYTMFEATRIPDIWVEAGRRCALVVVPTESSRQAWLASGFPATRLVTCPLGINPETFGGPTEPLTILTQGDTPITGYRVRFLNLSELGPRKNLIGLLRTWLLATRRDDDAILLVKLGRYAPGWFESLLVDLRQVERQAGNSFDLAAPVEFLFDLLPDGDLPRLYATATHYISLSHGEGWDQPMVEAAASGLQLIAPDHSAYRDYLTPETATLIPSREIPAHFKGDPELRQLFAGATWWEPDEDAAAMAIRAAIDGTTLPRYGAKERVLGDLTWEHAARRLAGILSDLAVSGRRV
jgi:glycosyltransferase involved in cell wall biosynthesis